MILDTLNQVIQILAFVFMGMSLLVFISMVQRVYRSIYGHLNHLKGTPSIGLIRLPRDIVMILIFGFLGAAGFFFSSSLRGYNVFTNETQVGTLTYLGQSTVDPTKMRIEYQKTDEEGEPIGNPVVVESSGDSMILHYSLVAVKPNYMILGIKQLYKVDYVGGDWSDGRNEDRTIIPIEGGRQKRYKEMRDPDKRSFPYSLWVKSVQFKRVEFGVRDLKKNVKCKIYLVHNALHLIEDETFVGAAKDQVHIVSLGIYSTNNKNNAANIDYGVLVTKVFADKAGEKAGLKTNDLITMVDGNKVEDTSKLRQLIGTQVESTYQIRIYRNDEEKKLTVINDNTKVEEKNFGNNSDW